MEAELKLIYIFICTCPARPSFSSNEFITNSESPAIIRFDQLCSCS
jgi:hypothetical protein